MEELPFAGWDIGPRAGVIGESHRFGRERSGDQCKRAQRSVGTINADVPDIGLVSGMLEKICGAQNIVGPQGAIHAIVAAVPQAGHGVAAKAQARAGSEVLQKQIPAQRTQLLVQIGDAIIAPARAIGIIIDGAAGEIDIGHYWRAAL